MNVYEQLDRMYRDREDSCKELLETLIEEIKTLKSMLTQHNRSHYYRFVQTLRKHLISDIRNGLKPKIRFDGNVYGVDEAGYFYDMKTRNVLKAHEAFEIYRYLYTHRNNLENIIVYEV